MSAVPVTPRAAARPTSVLRALTHAEGRRLLRHPLFLLGMALSIAIVVQASTNSPNEGGAFQQEIVDFFVGNFFLFVGGGLWTFLATFMATSRERRDGAEDFYAGQPVTPRTRTLAALLSVSYAGAAAAALVAVAALAFLGPDLAHDVLGTRVHARPFELVQGPLYLVLAGVLGVLLGTWTRHVWVALVATIALFLPPGGVVPWFVFDQDRPRGSFAAVVDGVSPGWSLLAMAGLVALAASIAMLRHDRRVRVAVVAVSGLGVTAAIAIAGPMDDGIVLGCTPDVWQPVGSARVVPARVTPGNLDFERGNLDGWRVRTQGGGSWRVYADGQTPPDRADSDPAVPFHVVDPPQGRFAAVTDMCTGGSRILTRDVALEGRRELRFTLAYRGTVPLTAPRTLDHRTSTPTATFRADVMDPRAPLDSLAARDVLATVYRTAPGDPVELSPRTVTFDLSAWAGRTVRLRFAQVDNAGPLRVVVDDVRLEPTGE